MCDDSHEMSASCLFKEFIYLFVLCIYLFIFLFIYLLRYLHTLSSEMPGVTCVLFTHITHLTNTTNIDSKPFRVFDFPLTLTKKSAPTFDFAFNLS